MNRSTATFRCETEDREASSSTLKLPQPHSSGHDGHGSRTGQEEKPLDEKAKGEPLDRHPGHPSPQWHEP